MTWSAFDTMYNLCVTKHEQHVELFVDKCTVNYTKTTLEHCYWDPKLIESTHFLDSAYKLCSVQNHVIRNSVMKKFMPTFLFTVQT